jgi:O-antigen/teichoic acid export membrane protein
MSLTKAVLRDSVLYALATAINKGAQLLVVPLYFSYLSEGGPGLVDLVICYSAVIVGFLGLGLTNGFARELGGLSDSELSQQRLSSTLLWASVGLSVLFVPLSWCSRSLLPAAFEQNSQLAILLGGLTIALQFQDVVMNHYRWTLQAPRFLLLTAVYVVAVIAGTVFAFRTRGASVETALTALAGATLLTGFVGIGLDYRVFARKPSGRALRRMLAFCLPLVPASIVSVAAGYMPRFATGASLSPVALDTLMLALKTAGVLAPFLAAITQSMLAHVYREYANPETPKSLATLHSKFLGLAVFALFGMVLFAPWLTDLLGKGKRPEAAEFLGLAALTTILSQSYVFFVGAWIEKRTGAISAIAITTAVLNILLNLWAVPNFGIWGGLGATLVAWSFSYLASYLLSQKLYTVPFSISQQLLAFGLMVGACWLPLVLPAGNSWASIVARIAGLVLLAGVLVLCGLMPNPKSIFRKP